MQTRGLKDLVKGHAEKAEHGKVQPFAFIWDGKLLSGSDYNSENDSSHTEADPHDGGRGDFTKGDLGSDERPAPNKDGEQSFEVGEDLGFGHLSS